MKNKINVLELGTADKLVMGNGGTKSESTKNDSAYG